MGEVVAPVHTIRYQATPPTVGGAGGGEEGGTEVDIGGDTTPTPAGTIEYRGGWGVLGSTAYALRE